MAETKWFVSADLMGVGIWHPYHLLGFLLTVQLNHFLTRVQKMVTSSTIYEVEKAFKG